MVEAMIPDPDFAGYGIFDHEDWRALYSENDDGLSYSNHYSVQLVMKAHPDWTNTTQIAAQAELEYNQGSQLFFTETLNVAKRLRPKGKFGFYECVTNASQLRRPPVFFKSVPSLLAFMCPVCVWRMSTLPPLPSIVD
jgi:hypothetical protein